MLRHIRLWGTFVLVAALAPPAAAGEAEASATPPAGVDTARVQLATQGHETAAFVAWPEGHGAVPAVVVEHEWWGLNGQIRDFARTLAHQGYAVIVPDLYHGKVADDPERAHILMRGLERDVAVGDLEAAIGWLRAQPRTAKSRVGTLGFCMGGGLSLALALASDQVDAAVMFYGTPDTDPADLANLRAPLMAHFGAEDEGITAERVQEFRNALGKAGKKAEIFTYAGAGHAFMNDTRPSYSPDAAKLAWARTLAFLQKHLKG